MAVIALQLAENLYVECQKTGFVCVLVHLRTQNLTEKITHTQQSRKRQRTVYKQVHTGKSHTHTHTYTGYIEVYIISFRKLRVKRHSEYLDYYIKVKVSEIKQLEQGESGLRSVALFGQLVFTSRCVNTWAPRVADR